MSALLDGIRRALDDRIAALRPAAEEFERLKRAAEALDRVPAGGSSSSATTSGRRARTTAPARSGAKPARRGPAPPRPERAAPGQTQLRVIEQLRGSPGSTSAAVAATLGISANAAAATISRLVRQGRVRRLDTGGYAATEPEAPADSPSADPPPPHPTRTPSRS